MNGEERRERILGWIKEQETPLSASQLALRLGVSRQVIVGDIALLRAAGNDILATARGYILPQIRPVAGFFGKLACCHDGVGAEEELYTIVDLGGVVVDVIVEHHLYGEMSGYLNLSTRQDVDQFFQRVRQQQAQLLSALTGGVHLHTIGARDKTHLEEIKQALGEKGLLYAGRDGETV